MCGNSCCSLRRHGSPGSLCDSGNPLWKGVVMWSVPLSSLPHRDCHFKKPGQAGPSHFLGPVTAWAKLPCFSKTQSPSLPTKFIQSANCLHAREGELAISFSCNLKPCGFRILSGVREPSALGSSRHKEVGRSGGRGYWYNVPLCIQNSFSWAWLCDLIKD